MLRFQEGLAALLLRLRRIRLHRAKVHQEIKPEMIPEMRRIRIRLGLKQLTSLDLGQLRPIPRNIR